MNIEKKMNCTEFEGHIQSFINGELPDEMYDGFIEHYNSCRECNEELEILYLVHNVINNSEQENFSYNLKGRLKSHLKDMEDQMYRRYKIRFLRNTAIILAEAAAFLSAVVFLLQYI